MYNRYSNFLKQKYGVKVYKLPVHIPVSCPNRDGNLSTGGCTYCGEIGAGFECLSNALSVAEQIETNKQYIKKKYKAEKFIAYFQNYSNTYLPLETFIRYIGESCLDDIVAIAISTRPDCIHDDYLAALDAIRKENKVDICIELGLQTVNYKSLIRINRGHTLAEFIDAVMRIQTFRFDICAHVILNLPYDDMTDVIETAKIISVLGIPLVKLHALYIVKDTRLAEEYLAGLSLITKDEYMERVITFLEYLSDSIVVERLIGRAPKSETLFVNWDTSWWKIHEEIEQAMLRDARAQGRLFDYTNGKALQSRKD